GRALATSIDGSVVTPLTGDSQYFVVIASPDKTGVYQVAAAFANAPDDTCRPRKTYTDPDSDAAAITADSCYQTIPGSGDQLYYNFYNFTVPAAGVVTLSASSGDFTPTLYLLDEAANTLAVDSTGGGYDTTGNARSVLRTQLPPGNYRAQVFSDVPSGGA